MSTETPAELLDEFEAAWWDRANAEANAYVERETRKFIERMRRNVEKRWGDPNVANACFREEYVSPEREAVKNVIAAFSESVC